MGDTLRSLMIALCLFGACRPSALGQGRTETSLDGPWKFQFGQVEGDTASGFDDSHFGAISVPHSWPPEGELLSKGGFRANATYRKTFVASPTWQGKRVILRFDAVSLAADVTLNGQHVGGHKGGFAAFNFDVTDLLHYGASNLLAVHVSNELDPDLSPLAGDFTIYGGIYRHVSLVVLDPVHINPFDFASPGVFLRQQSVSPDAAAVELRSEIANQSAASANVTVKANVLDREGHSVFSGEKTVRLAAQKSSDVIQMIRLDHPHLWNGVADPYLYSVQIDLFRDGHVVDRVIQPLGLRTERIDPASGMILNGRALPIHGVCLHQEGATAGWAVSAEDEFRDMQLIRDMGANGIRLAHYQHSQSFLDMADRTGMLIWAELAQVDRVSPTEAYRDNIRQHLQELIRQNFNHPSIFVWSLYNELNSPTKDASIPLVAELNELAHHEDPGRPTSGAASEDTIEHLHPMVAGVDLIALNAYPGWYVGQPEDMGEIIDKWNAAYGNRGIAITEYGAGASPRQHQADVTKKDVEIRGHFHPEEWQAIVHEGDYAAIRDRPFVWGSFIWNMFDFSSLGRHEGDTNSLNDKGLVTRDRSTRKDAYFFYQANWSETPMVHLTGCRNTNLKPGYNSVKAYSNQEDLVLTVNGTSFDPADGSSLHVFSWPSVPLKIGENMLIVTSPGGTLDRCSLNVLPPSP